ncbi:CDP-glycerol glycerophosphotransferase family protein [Enterococcus mediterraneensis]|uniref:CDP-glycerol glycerophosphotransferase family protein n=1 Tax=Enterococcus mediterraneensis TaxID=2364791 RepID=UPI0013E0B862|nr:CDP-glycerol glycerophosphotransferase family protein [Enterococcus mediterraneensis]
MKKMISYLFRMLFNFSATVFPVKAKTVVFESFNGKKPSDSPYAIYLALEKSQSDFACVWGVKKKFLQEARHEFPDIQFVSRFSLQWLLLMTRANYWVFNSRMPIWLKKNKKTIYIQTWHGTPLKKLGMDIENVSIPGTNTAVYKQEFVEEAKRWDYLVAPNQFSKEIFQRAFQFQNHFLDIGYPRNDVLVQHKDDPSYIDNLKKQIIGKDTGRVILYAPTWRDDYFISKGNYRFYMPFDLKKITQLLAKEDTLIIRPHYLVGDSISVQGYEENIRICIDEDINDLYLISDLLITDYSSVMFDYAILKRPMLFYAYDYEHYKENLRGFYFDYAEVPGPIVTDEKQFYEKLQSFLESDAFKGYQKKYNDFYQRFCQWEDGHAAEKVAFKLAE